MESLYSQVRRRKTLENAWRVVYDNGVASKSELTRKQVNEFAVDVNRHLNRIAAKLRYKRFDFLPSEGILIKKPGKSAKRPIVISPVENRIVQRAILDVLQAYAPLEPYFKVETSFGGIKERGVPEALKAVYVAMASHSHFIRSDIDSFFTKIPKETIVNTISSLVRDNDLIALFRQAITVQLSNLDQLGEDRNSFPIYDIGVAQGSCLSPLIGNILLCEFDRAMNSGDIVCIRYVDDFLILAPTKKAANAAFKRANKQLAQHGLAAYDPATNRDKAEHGETLNGFSFLGCDVRPGMIRPNKKSQKNLLSSIDEIFAMSVRLMGNPGRLVREHRSVVEALKDASNILKGWGNQYAFCNDLQLMERIDAEVNRKIASYLSKYGIWKRKTRRERR